MLGRMQWLIKELACIDLELRQRVSDHKREVCYSMLWSRDEAGAYQKLVKQLQGMDTEVRACWNEYVLC